MLLAYSLPIKGTRVNENRTICMIFFHYYTKFSITYTKSMIKPIPFLHVVCLKLVTIIHRFVNI